MTSAAAELTAGVGAHREIGGVMHSWKPDPPRRPGRLESDCSAPLADQRRVLLVGESDDWRLLTSYLFEDAGYTAYAAADGRQAVTLVARLLPDVVVVQMDAPDGLDVLMRLREDARAADIPVVVLTAWIESVHAQRVRALGGVPLAPDATDIKALVGEVGSLIVVAARGARALKRRLLDLRELARYYSPDAEGRAQLRRLIDQLQVAIFAVDEHGHCIAASDGGGCRIVERPAGMWTSSRRLLIGAYRPAWHRRCAQWSHV